MSQLEIDTDSLTPLVHTLDDQNRLSSRSVSTAPRIPPPTGSNLMSIEEWDAIFKIPERVAADELAQRHCTAAAVPPKPRNYDAIPRFNHLCQVHCLTSSFTFEEVTQGLFSCKVTFGDFVSEEAGPFTSKKLAKGAVAERALITLESFESSPKERATKKTKMRSSDGNTSSSDEADEDWITILNLFAQNSRHTQPDFQFSNHNSRLEQILGKTDSPVQFSCTLSLQARPDYLFGSEATLHPSKAEAKRLAAKDAVLWLRTIGRLPETPPAPSRLKGRESSTSTDEGHAGPAQEMSPLNTDHSPAQLVVALSLRLGLSQPRFECKPAGQNFYNCTAHYLDQDVLREPQLYGPLCPTSPVHGQKNAKKMCCQDLLCVLERIAAERRMS